MASYDVYLYLQYGQSPLMMALSRRHVKVVSLLLDKGAEVNHLDKVSYSSIVVIMFKVFRLHVPDGL